MPRPARNPEELEQQALEQFYDWRNMEAVEQQGEAAIQFTAAERNLHVTLHEPGPVTVRYADGRVETRPMNAAELAAWQNGLDPELDEVRKDG